MGVSKLNRGDLIVKGRCDGMGDISPDGSYVRIVYSNDLGDYGLTVSEGAAAVLIDELHGALGNKVPVAAPGNWQPIETAPCDYTQVLVCYIKRDGDRFVQQSARGPHVDGWGNSDTWYASIDGDIAVLWMPLPKPPHAS